MICTLKEFLRIKEKKLKGKTIVTASGFFDPIHPGHVSSIVEAKKFGDILVVIVNGDMQCITKKGKPFMPVRDRAEIVDALKGVDYTVLYDHPTKYCVAEALEAIRPDVHTKGGDRVYPPTGPLLEDVNAVEGNGGRIEYNVGAKKIWSSSNYLQEWVDFVSKEKK